MIYEWFVSDDGSAVHIYERYADSDATMAHFGAFDEHFKKQFELMVHQTRFYAYGSPSDACRDALTRRGAQVMSAFGGFAR